MFCAVLLNFTLAVPAQMPSTIEVAVATKPSTERALRYLLYPENLDLEPGNAALLWIRAGRASQLAEKFGETQQAWIERDKTPLSELPDKEVEAFLAAHKVSLRLGDSAARKQTCDWQIPPLMFATANDVFPYEELQFARELARVLKLQFRYHLKHKRYERAAHSLQTSFALARHVGNADLVLQHLVGVAIASVTSEQIEEWIQQPDSPNLYWPISVLPKPFLDDQRAIRYELNTFYRSFPFLREIERNQCRVLSERELNDITKEVKLTMSQFQGQELSEFETRLLLAAYSLKVYPEAKAELRERGWEADKVDAMPVLQVVALSVFHQYSKWRDEFLQWHAVPYWQGQPHVREVERRLTRAIREHGQNNVFLLVLPALSKTREASVRVKRHMAALRCVEAIRLYASNHEGRLPETLGQVTDVPLPVDPVTGRGFDEYYTKNANRAVFDVPPMSGQPRVLGKRYVFGASR